jgi:hypothetical protein
VKGKRHDVLEIDLFGGVPARDLELETGTRNQQTADAARAISMAKVFRHAPHAIGCQLAAHGAKPSTLKNEE